MTSLANALKTLREEQQLGELERLYLHRATRETPYGLYRGREAIAADLLDELDGHPDQQVEIHAELPEAISFTVGAAADAAKRIEYRVHHWVRLEGERIAAEVVIRDEAAILDRLGTDLETRARSIGEAMPAFRPLGEIRSGQGQLGAGKHAVLPCGVSPGAAAVLDAWHRIWNGRAFDQIPALYAPQAQWAGPRGRNGGREDLRAWLSGLLAHLPDAWLLFDRIAEGEGRLALLWRLVANENGRRLRVLGSSILTVDGGRIAADDTLLDEVAVRAQRYQPFLEL